MSSAIDPFEEYLRKKKVEMLEQKYRGGREPGRVEEDPDDPDTAADIDPLALQQEDPAAAQRIAGEVNEFFSEGQNAAARLFDRMGEGITEEKVDEIRDALDEVLVEEAPKPQEEDGDGTFVNFFKQVQEDFSAEGFDQDADDSQHEVVAGAVEEPELLVVAEPEAVAAQPLELELPTEEPVELPPPVDPPSAPEVTAVLQNLEPPPPIPEFSGAPEEPVASEPEAEPGTRLDLAEVLATPADTESEMRRRIDLLCRLIARLVERSELPENEIVECLIKAGIEF